MILYLGGAGVRSSTIQIGFWGTVAESLCALLVLATPLCNAFPSTHASALGLSQPRINCSARWRDYIPFDTRGQTTAPLELDEWAALRPPEGGLVKLKNGSLVRPRRLKNGSLVRHSIPTQRFVDEVLKEYAAAIAATDARSTFEWHVASFYTVKARLSSECPLYNWAGDPRCTWITRDAVLKDSSVIAPAPAQLEHAGGKLRCPGCVFPKPSAMLSRAFVALRASLMEALLPEIENWAAVHVRRNDRIAVRAPASN